jgi:hypothetical protein
LNVQKEDLMPDFTLESYNRQFIEHEWINE